MRRIVKGNMIAEHFESIHEFAEVVGSRTPQFGDTREKTSYDPRWRGEEKIETAWEKLQYGDTSLLKEWKETLSGYVKTTGKTVRNRTFNDVIGFAPNVPNLLMGVPKTMINQQRVVRKNKVITLLCDISVSCGVDKSRVIKHGTSVVRAIQQLESSGYRVEVNVMGAFAREEESTKKHLVFIPIKSANQPLDLQKIAYPMTSVAMFRYLGFDWYESLPEAKRLSGYGYPLSAWDGDAREELLKKAYPNRKNVIYIKFGDEVSEILQQAEK